MITIKAVENKELPTQFLVQNGVHADISDHIVMCAMDKDELLAVGSLSMIDYKVYLNLAVATNAWKGNAGFMLGLMKSLLNLADLRGIKTVYGTNPDLFDFYRLLRFQEDTTDGGRKIYSLDLEGYFTVDSCTHTE